MKKALSIFLVLVFLFSLGTVSYAAITELGTNESIIEGNIGILKQNITKKYNAIKDGDLAFVRKLTNQNSTWTQYIRYNIQKDTLLFCYLFESYTDKIMVNAVTMEYNNPSVPTSLKYQSAYQLDIYNAHSAFSSQAESVPFYAQDYVTEVELKIASISSTVSSFIDSEKTIFSSHAALAVDAWDNLVEELCGFGLAGIGFKNLCNKHEFVETVEISATCEQEGLKTCTCKNCTYSYEETLEPLGHSKISREGVCSRCVEKVIDVSKCSCSCHKNDFFSKLITSIKMIFWKMFKTNKTCKCGTTHY